MAEITQRQSPFENPDGFRQFAFVVDGDVGWVAYLSVDGMQGPIACLLSNPTIIEVTGELKTLVDVRGWTHDGENFIPPQNNA